MWLITVILTLNSVSSLTSFRRSQILISTTSPSTSISKTLYNSSVHSAEMKMPVLSDATLSTTASDAILHIQAQAIARRLRRIILPNIYDDVSQARTNLLLAVKTSSGGGDWSSKVVSDSSFIRESTNTAVACVSKAEKLVDALLLNLEDPQRSQQSQQSQRSRSSQINIHETIETITQLIQQAKQSLVRAKCIAVQASLVQVDQDFGTDIQKAQKIAVSKFVFVAQFLTHASSICWIARDGRSQKEKEEKEEKEEKAMCDLPKSIATTKMNDNAAEQLVLPFVPPQIKKRPHPIKREKNVVSAVNCDTFCKPKARSKTKLRKTACIHGCRVATAELDEKSWPGKWTERVDCQEYCEKTVDQVILEEGQRDDTDNNGNTNGLDADVVMEKEDQRAMWVVECNYSCKKN